MKHMKFLTFFFCIAFAVFACSSNNETDPNAGGIPDKEEPLATDFAKGADISWVTEIYIKTWENQFLLPVTWIAGLPKAYSR